MVQVIAVNYAGLSRRARRRSSFARPYICRFTSFSLVFCPSVWPFDQGCVRAVCTAAWSKEAGRAWLATSGLLGAAVSPEMAVLQGLRNLSGKGDPEVLRALTSVDASEACVGDSRRCGQVTPAWLPASQR